MDRTDKGSASLDAILDQARRVSGWLGALAPLDHPDSTRAVQEGTALVEALVGLRSQSKAMPELSDATPEDVERANAFFRLHAQMEAKDEDCEDDLALAAEFARVRAEVVESSAKLLEEVRCRVWSPAECAMAIRRELHPLTCGMWRWRPCDCEAQEIGSAS